MLYNLGIKWLTSAKTLIGQGANLFRVNFAMERLTPDDMTGAYDSAYNTNLTDVSMLNKPADRVLY